MMKLAIKFILTVLLLAPIGGANASGTDASSLLSAWGNPSMQLCQGPSNYETCVGDSLPDCSNWKNKDPKSNRGTYDDEGATLLLVARAINENGGKFCVIQVQGRNKNKKSAWTEYFNPGSDSDCVWLCKSGHHGSECSETGTPTRCDSQPLNKEKFKNYKRLTNKNATNIEESIPMFYMNQNKKCYGNRKEEHDMILAISKWAPSGHGAFAQPTIFRAERDGDKHMVSTATITFVGTATLLCKEGYAPNSGGTDCDPIDATMCALTNMCTGWSGFDAATHKITAAKSGGCNEYRCLQPKYGFKSEADKTCAECGEDARHGTNSDNGVCVACDVGSIFDGAKNQCVAASHVLGRDAMVYGPNKDRDTKPLGDQCWTKPESTEYKNCVIPPTAAEKHLSIAQKKKLLKEKNRTQ